MIVRTLGELKGSTVDVGGERWRSVRFLTRSDNVGFTVTSTVLEAGHELVIEYKNHIEANYCIDGEGEVTDLATDTVHRIHPGTLYALDKNERHKLSVFKTMHLICVFAPALLGTETPEPDGSYRNALDLSAAVAPRD